MDSMGGDITLHPSERFSGRDAIQTPYAEYDVGSNLPQVSEKELAKLQKRAEKGEKVARANLAASQVRIMCTVSCQLHDLGRSVASLAVEVPEASPQATACSQPLASESLCWDAAGH